MKRILLLTVVAWAVLLGRARADMSAGNQKITNLATGVANTDAANVGQLGGLSAGHAALSVLGVTANATGTPADIAAGTDGFVLRRSGTSLAFGTLPAGAFAAGTIANTALIASGVTAATYGSATQVAVCAFNAAGVASSCSSTSIAIDASAVTSGLLAVARGGTGVGTSTGSGNVVLSTSPTLVTPVLGAATATTINKLTFTQPATGSTLTLLDGVTLTVSSTLNTNQLALLASPTFTGNVTLPAVTLGGAFAAGGNNITNIQDPTYKYVSDGNKTGANPALADFTTGKDHTWTLTGNVTGTPTWTWPSLSSTVFYANVQVCQDATGSRTSAWPTSPTLAWIGGSAPTLSTTASACDYISFRYDGTTVVGYFASSGGGNALTSNPLSQFAATTSSQFAGVISDETGTGAVVLATSPTLVTPTLGAASATSLALGNGNVTAGKQYTYNGVVSGGNKTGANVALFDWTTGSLQTITLTGNVTGTSTCTAPTGTARVTAIILQDGTGSRTIASYCPNTKWAGAAAPTLTTTASRPDIMSCLYDGTNYYCSLSANFN